ncbi:retrotransposon gag domain, retroviral aspartyl protease, partial [Tanacetum coccineum]
MVQTRNNPDTGSGANDPIATQLAAIAAKLEAMESLKEDIADLKRQAANKQRSCGSGSRYEEVESSHSNHTRRPFHKIEFPVFSGGDPRGWRSKAEKYFRFYNTLDEEKVDVAAMHLEGDALDLYSWMSAEHEIIYWEELINVLQKHFGPPEFQNPDEYLCSIKQTGSVHEYRQEFARRSARISNWPDHCLLEVFLNGLKDELKADVRIHKPRTLYKAMSLALEFESKINHCRPEKKTTWNSQLKPDSKPFTAGSYSPVLANQPKPDPKSNLRITDAEKQNRFLKGECFRCGDKYGPGHRCKTGTFKVLEAEEENGEQQEIETIFRPFLRRFILVFFDDILIYSQDMEHHVLHLEQTLKLLHDIHFFVKLSKCCFGQTKVLFLGHVVTSEGVQVEQEKLSAVKSWSIHSNVKQSILPAYETTQLLLRSGLRFLKYSRAGRRKENRGQMPSLVYAKLVPDFHLVDQFLFCKNCLVIPEVSNIKLKLLQEAHTTPLGGHGGFLKTIKRLNAQYFWPKMKEEVRLFVQQCVVCQQQKYQTLSPAGLLQPLPIPTQSVALVFCKEIVRLHGFPRSIVLDRDEQFPNFRLEDKSFYQEGNNDTTELHVYTRKQKRVKTYGLDLNELDQFNAIFGIWLDPLGQEKNEIME